ncbi:unnamed protein product [Rotaria sp. Silwood1]|nr:unnamed protein product [Rotaria sp. Silwood1]CAF3494304.1 unnamed protein product [Rotaria sp. Silwood1]CAF4724035.1 unnamed protein product [Rotaria sp. Silwood1]CAF4781720.1 unnamed protein product [Rotaria sp. Silwood1]CAF4938686.1 unnamed protein product [Rotaria sp. Silwood1]
MNSMNDDQTSSCSSDIDICNTSPNSSQKLSEITITSTPYPTHKPRVNFHSIESLAISSLNTSSLTPTSFSFQRHDDTGYSSLNSSTLTHDKDNKENVYCSTITTVNERKPRRKLTDWQIWHLRQTYAKNRYPSPYEQEQLAVQLLLPLSSIRIWFQNHRARSGKK